MRLAADGPRPASPIDVHPGGDLGPAANDDRIGALQGALRRWRLTAGTAAALAAGLALFIAVGGPRPGTGPGTRAGQRTTAPVARACRRVKTAPPEAPAIVPART